MATGDRTERRMQLVIASIAAGSALLGALVGGGVSYLGTREQIKAGRDQLVSRRIRPESTTYASSERRPTPQCSVTPVSTPTLSEMSGFKRGSTAEIETWDPDVRAKLLREVNKGWRVLQRDLIVIRLLGESDVVESAELLTDSQWGARERVLEYAAASDEEQASADKAYQEALAQSGHDLETFTASVRKSLEVEVQ